MKKYETCSWYLYLGSDIFCSFVYQEMQSNEPQWSFATLFDDLLPFWVVPIKTCDFAAQPARSYNHLIAYVIPINRIILHLFRSFLIHHLCL